VGENIALSDCQNGSLRGYYQEEELPVTLQVALIASDGWVLASDTLETFDAGTIELASSVEKLHLDADIGVACSVSGDKWAFVARDRFLTKVASVRGNLRIGVLNEIATEIWQEIPVAERNRTERKLIVIFRDDPKHLYVLPILDGVCAIQKRDFATAGHDRNPAHFFIQRYYIRGATTRNTVDQLKLLAAHTILAAAKHHTSIQGLSMIVCRDGCCEPLSDDQIEELRLQSEAVDKELISRFGVAQ